MEAVDGLISAGWIATVDSDDRVLAQHSLVIHDGRIRDLLPSTQAEQRYRPSQRHELPDHLLIPGLVNVHTHAAMTLLRGYADDLPLSSWLQDRIWPAEARWVSEEFVEDGTRLAVAEMLRGGTTCFNDMYFFPDVVARVAAHAGMRAVVGLIVLDFPTVWARDADEYLARGLDVHDSIKSEPLISSALAPHAPYTVSDQPLSQVAMYADELELPIHMHVNETAAEVAEARERGESPLDRLDRLGLLSPSLLAVHMTQLDTGEADRLARAGATVVHCPESNLKLASGRCPVQALRDAGVRVVLGTDGAASNNDLDMLGEMRSAALLAKSVAEDAAALPTRDALRMCTADAAAALGLGETIGSLEIGKAADVVAVDLARIETQPLYDPVSQLIYSATREQVTDVWIAGRQVLRRRRLTLLNEPELLAGAARWSRRIRDEA